MPLLSGPVSGRLSSGFNAQTSFNLASVKALRIACVAGLAIACSAGIPLAAQTAHFSSAVNILPKNGLIQPYSVAIDASGNLFVADIDTTSIKELLAASGYTTSVTLGGGFSQPSAVAVDSSGNVFVADTGNNAIKEIVAAGGYTTINTLSSSFAFPYGVAVDSSGNVFVADTAHDAIKEIVAAGGYKTINTLGSGGGFDIPFGVTVDGSGNVFVADTYNNAVKEILAAGGYTTVKTLSSSFNLPQDVAVDASGNVFVSDTINNEVKEILAAGGYTTIQTLGSGFRYPAGVIVDGKGNIFVGDEGNGVVKEIVTSGVNFGAVAIATSTPPVTQFYFTFDSVGSVGAPMVLMQGATGLDFADAGTGSCTTNGASHVYNTGDACTVDVTFTPKYPGQRLGAVQLVSTASAAIATAHIYGTGTGPLVTFPGNTVVNTIGSGFFQPESVAVDGSGNVFVADYGNKAVKEIVAVGGLVSSTSTVNTIGSGFSGPYGIAVDGSGNVFVADRINSAVKEIVAVGGMVSSSSPVITVVSIFRIPSGVAVDGSGNVFVADAASNTVSEIVAVGGVVSSSSAVKTIGSGFNGPEGLKVDGSGNVFVADYFNNAVKEIVAVGGVVSSSSMVNTIGSGFRFPTDVAVDGSGNVFVADGLNSAVKEIVAVGGVVSSSSMVNTIGSGFSEPWGVTVDGSGNVLVADVSSSMVKKIDLSDPPSLSFPTATNVGSTDSTDGVRTVTVANNGNAVLNFPIPASGNNPGISVDFTLDSTSSGTCPLTGSTRSTSGTLAAGATCTLPINFAPTVGGTISGSLVLTDTNLNASPSTTQTISLNGTGKLITATLAFAAIPAHTFGDTPFIVTATSLSSGTVTYTVTSGPATISGSTLTITGTGTVTLSASQAATSTYTAAIATTSFNIKAATPTLAFATIPAHTFGDAPFAVTATSASSGAVTYTVTSGPATISGNLLTITGTGTVTLSASQTAAGNYAAATATTSFSDGVATPSLAFATIPAHTYGDAPFTVTATSVSSGAVTYTVTSGPATISGNLLAITGTGTVTLSASQAAAGNYAVATATTSFNVGAETPTLAFAAIPAHTYGDTPFAVTATSASSGAVTYTVTSGPATLAGGTLTIIGTGTVTLQASQAAAGNYAAATATTSFNVTSTIPAISFASNSHTYGDTPFAVSATSNSTGAFTYSVVSGPATISGSTVTIAGAGTVTLQATQAADSNYSAGTQQATFLVAQAPLTVTANNATRAYGATNPTFTGSISATKYNDSLTESFSTAATTATPVGSYSITPSASGSSLGNYTVSPTNGTLNITQAGTTTVLAASTSAANQPTTLTANVASTTSGTPTGTVTILDNGTALQTVTLTNGTASYSTTLTAGATHALTASYTGDANFLSSASSATGTSVTVSPLDFTFSGTGIPATQTVAPGQMASFTYNLAPTSGSGSYPGAVSLTVSGCPTGSTCTLSPTSFAANAGAQTVTLAVQTAAVTARSREGSTPWSLALLLLPLAGARRLRRSSQRLQKLLLAAVFLFAGAALGGLTGCGGSASTPPQSQNYSITVTAASGAVQHTSTVTLNVQ